LIFGKVAKDVYSGQINFETANIGPYSLGFIAAFIAGLIACNWMISLVKNSKLYYFAIYCFIIGTVAIAYAYFYL
jgi:undecaprenyl-diphosphatase